MQRGGLRSLPTPTISQRHGGVATDPDRGEPDFQVREKAVWQAARSLAVRRRARSALKTSPGLDGLIEEEVALDVAEPLVERDCRLGQAGGRPRPCPGAAAAPLRRRSWNRASVLGPARSRSSASEAPIRPVQTEEVERFPARQDFGLANGTGANALRLPAADLRCRCR